jgi:hypothetical protein
MLGLSVPVCTWSPLPAKITELRLSRFELVTGPGKENDLKTEISTLYEDPEGDVVTFSYKISAGKIVGYGAKVTWDLTGVGPGVYTITAGVNDGSGVLRTITRSVEILACDTCRLRETD